MEQLTWVLKNSLLARKLFKTQEVLQLVTPCTGNSSIYSIKFYNGTLTLQKCFQLLPSIIELASQASQASHIILYKHFWTNGVLLHICLMNVLPVLILWIQCWFSESWYVQASHIHQLYNILHSHSNKFLYKH